MAGGQVSKSWHDCRDGVLAVRRAVVGRTTDLPPTLAAAIAADAWIKLQHGTSTAWRAGLLAARVLLRVSPQAVRKHAGPARFDATPTDRAQALQGLGRLTHRRVDKWTCGRVRVSTCWRARPVSRHRTSGTWFERGPLARIISRIVGWVGAVGTPS